MANSPTGSSSADSGGFVANVLAPMMKVIGLGIASRGGALGPMLASSGDYITQSRDERLKQAAMTSLLPLLQRQGSETITPGIPAIPGRPSVMPAPLETAAPEASVAPAAEQIIPGTMGTPAVPPVTRTWDRVATQGEVLRDLSQLPEGRVRNLATEMALKYHLPTSPERPQSVQEEIARREEERLHGRGRGELLTDEQRRIEQKRADQERQIAELVKSGMSESLARSTVIGGLPYQPATRTEYRDGKKVTLDATTGRTLREEPIQTPEQQAMARSVPELAQQFEAAVTQGVYTQGEAQLGRQLLKNAAITGDLTPFTTFAKGVFDRRSKEKLARDRRAGVGFPSVSTTTSTTDVPSKRIENKEHIKRLESAIPNVVKGLEAQYGKLTPGQAVTVKTKNGPKTMTAEELIAHAMYAQHGVIARVQGTPAGYFTGPGWSLIEAATPAESRTTRSTTTRARGRGAAADEEDED